MDDMNQWLIENGPFASEDEADQAWADHVAEQLDELYREEDRYRA